MSKILIIEDDENLATLLLDALEAENHTVEIVHDGLEGEARALAASYDLMIVDCELPGRSGLEICREFRASGGQTPLIFLTGKDRLSDKEGGFSAGADDYLTKPFSMLELLLRIRALLRRPHNLLPESLTVGHVVLETAGGRVTAAGIEIKLQPREFALLEFLMRHAGQVYTTEALLDRVWDADSEATPVALRSCITKLRKKIDVEGKPSIVHTLHGLGYKVEA